MHGDGPAVRQFDIGQKALVAVEQAGGNESAGELHGESPKCGKDEAGRATPVKVLKPCMFS